MHQQPFAPWELANVGQGRQRLGVEDIVLEIIPRLPNVRLRCCSGNFINVILLNGVVLASAAGEQEEIAQGSVFQLLGLGLWIVPHQDA